jgi:7-carboxy-7-deazaguanine synthase
LGERLNGIQEVDGSIPFSSTNSTIRAARRRGRHRAAVRFFMNTVTISELYPSIQGESTRAGLPCTFVRLTGCGLRCVWCDTAHAFHGGTEMPVEAVVAKVKELGIPLVELTGGEPLEQEGAFPLASALCDAGFTVLVETGGHVPIARLDPRAVRIVDWKAPGSGMERSNIWENVADLRPHDEVKCVVGSRADFDWLLRRLAEHRVAGRVAAVLVSPVWGEVALDQLAQWVRDAPHPLRLNLQLHKVIWGDRPGV